MEKLNEDFNVPFYLFESILEYINAGKPSYQWPTLYTLIKIAETNNHFSAQQTDRLLEILK